MLNKTLLLFCFVFICFAGLASAQVKTIVCPQATAYKQVKITQGRPESELFAQYEEFCQQKSKSKGSFKQGAYRLWGPNGEVLVEGQYANGKKDGKWKRWIPGQFIEEFWTKGKLGESKGSERNDFLTIDFERCLPQKGGFLQGNGTGNPWVWSYEVFGAEGAFCKIKYSFTMESDGIFPGTTVPWNYCRVPRAKNKFSFNAFMPSPNEYCEVKNELLP